MKNDDVVEMKANPAFNLDSFLEKLSAYVSTGSVQDRGLKLLSYICWFLSKTISRSHKGDEWYDGLSKDFRKIYQHLYMARYANRLFGIPSCIEGIRSGSWGDWGSDYDNSCVSKSTRIKLGKFMAWSMLFYYPLEHAAYAHWVAPKVFRVNAEKLSAWSCRFWALYVIGDIAQSLLKLKVIYQKCSKLEYDLNKGEGGDNIMMNERVHPWEKKKVIEYLQLLRNSLYMLPLINWSLPNWESDPWLGESLVNSLCFSESAVCFWQSIYSNFR